MQQTQPLHNRGDGSIRNTANRRRDQIVRHVAFHHFALVHREEETLNGRTVLLHGKCRVLEGDSGFDGPLMKRCVEQHDYSLLPNPIPTKKDEPISPENSSETTTEKENDQMHYTLGRERIPT